MSVLVSQQLVMQQLVNLGYEIQGENMPNVNGSDERSTNADFYLEPHFLPSSFDAVDKVGGDEYLHVLQVDAFTKTGTGNGQLLTFTDSLLTNFNYGSELNNGDTKVIFNELNATPGGNDGRYYRQIFSINYRVITPKLGA
jgi:hypothetical protein